MSRFSRDSKFRLRDFKTRSEDNVYLNKFIKQEYIPIHPFGCEYELLKNLNQESEGCTAVDAYWNMKSDVSFIQVVTMDEFKSKTPGLYIMWKKNKREYLNLVSIVDYPIVTREIFEKSMVSFINHKIKPSEKNRKNYPTNLKFVGTVS